MIYMKTILNVIDNSGAQIAECIKVLRHGSRNFAKVGDEITVVIKEAKPIRTDLGQSSNNRVKRRDICRAIVVRTKAPFRRPDGSYVRFDDNACVLINKNGDPLGTRVSSVVAKELKELEYKKIVALAPKVF